MSTVSLAIDGPVVRLALAAGLGLFLGLEREWSHRSAGVRTFALVSLLGATFTVLDRPLLLAAGGALVVVQGAALAARGLLAEEAGLSLTTAVSLLVAYGVGVLVGSGLVLAGVTVAVLSSLLLVLKRELHDFAWGLSRAELRAGVEFGVLAFVVYPALPAGALPVTVAGLTVAVEPRVVWLLVVSVAGIGMLNYAVVAAYGGRGLAVTGFLAGLTSSTAVVGSMLDYVRGTDSSRAVPYAVAAVLLADAAMALRNLAIALAFTLPDRALGGLAVPMGVVALGGVAVAATTADWGADVPVEPDSPFSVRNVLGFGLLFAAVLTGGGLATAAFGDAGFVVAAALSGLVSSAGATTSAVVLYRGGAVAPETAVLAVTVATGASVLVKVGLVVPAPPAFSRRVALWSVALLAGAVGGWLALAA
jgi:uncharacterized membrane protein (DUF4010 family)